VKIVKNNITINNWGIQLVESNNTTIKKNLVNNNIVGLLFERSNDNKIFDNDLCGNNVVKQEKNCEGNLFKDNNCGPPPPENGPPPEIILIIIISIFCTLLLVGMYIFKKRSSREAVISKSILSPQELEGLQKTEAEVDVKKEHHVCVVHRGKIVGAIYLCPKCETYYCMKCVKVLKKKGENCWVCDNKIEI
jgi:parallel beta-helix repeat protein